MLGDGLVVVWPSPRGGAWLHIAPSGVATAFTGKVDVGQDNQMAFRLLVAEELRADPADVRVVQGDTDVCPYDPGTFGSRSMPDAGEALRRAAAGARQILASGPPVAGTRRVEVLAAEPELTSPQDWATAGRPHAAPETAVVTGARRFVSDMELPGMLHGAVLRAPAPAAALRTVDCGPAEAMPGVTVVRDGDFVGVAAGDPVTARRAVAAIRADWDMPAPGPADLAGYLRAHPVAGHGWQRAVRSETGDADAALAAAATQVKATYTTAYLAHVPLETRAALAEWDDGRLTVWTGTNIPFAVRARLSQTFGISEAAIRVIVPPVGGGFGGKHGAEAVEAARLARGTGRPVKVRWNRAEEFQRGYLRPMAVIDVRAGLDAAGSITAWDFLDINAGASGFAFPYAVPNRRLRYQPADSPHAQGPYRALSATANTFARESHIDELAYVARADPLRFRLRHLDDERLAAVLKAAVGRFGWQPGWHRAGRPGGTGSGRGGGRAWPSAWRRAAGWRPAPRYPPTGPVTSASPGS